MFTRATKTQSRLRLALIGPSGSGKTFTALQIASQLGERIAVIDTERGSASKYADRFGFDVCNLDSFDPRQYVTAIKEAEQAGYDVLVIDSLSHAWFGSGGALELVDKAAKKSQSGNSYMAWREVTPLHNQLVDAMLQSRCHIIVTMRAKTEYVLETDSRGKQVPRKVGMAPIQRDGTEYEFDVVADLSLDHDFIVSKTRCNALDGLVIAKAAGVADMLKTWLTDGAPASRIGEMVELAGPVADIEARYNKVGQLVVRFRLNDHTILHTDAEDMFIHLRDGDLADIVGEIRKHENLGEYVKVRTINVDIKVLKQRAVAAEPAPEQQAA